MSRGRGGTPSREVFAAMGRRLDAGTCPACGAPASRLKVKDQPDKCENGHPMGMAKRKERESAPEPEAGADAAPR